MTLTVHTGRVSYAGPDRLDVTAKSAPPEGKAFAPSWKLVSWGLKMRAQAAKKRAMRESNADEFWEWSWKIYSMRYKERLRISYRQNRRAWDRLLGRERVVLVCYCTDATYCHRRVLADVLEKLGAYNAGEIEKGTKTTCSTQQPLPIHPTSTAPSAKSDAAGSA